MGKKKVERAEVPINEAKNKSYKEVCLYNKILWEEICVDYATRKIHIVLLSEKSRV